LTDWGSILYLKIFIETKQEITALQVGRSAPDWAKSGSRPFNQLDLIIIASLVSAGFHALVSGVMTIPLSQYVFVFVIAIALKQFSSSIVIAKLSYLVRWALIGGAVLAGLIFCTISIYSLPALFEIEKDYVKNCNYTPSPYYWGIGNFSIDYPETYFCATDWEEVRIAVEKGPYVINIDIKED
jgi:hypothetical protein